MKDDADMREFFAPIVLLAALHCAHAAPPTTYPLNLKDGSLSGAGAEIIRAQLRRDAARVFERGLADRDDRDLLPVEP